MSCSCICQTKENIKSYNPLNPWHARVFMWRLEFFWTEFALWCLKVEWSHDIVSLSLDKNLHLQILYIFFYDIRVGLFVKFVHFRPLNTFEIMSTFVSLTFVAPHILHNWIFVCCSAEHLQPLLASGGPNLKISPPPIGSYDSDFQQKTTTEESISQECYKSANRLSQRFGLCGGYFSHFLGKIFTILFLLNCYFNCWYSLKIVNRLLWYS